jgi:uncharacterized membrane protein (UPF0127 family)
MRVLNLDTGGELVRQLTVAATVFSRAVGLLGRTSLPRGEGLLISPCKGVHTFFMKFPIDVVFLDGDNRIIATLVDLRPQRLTKLRLACRSILELPAGTVRESNTAVGNQLTIV